MERERDRERERYEAGREPGSPGLRLPKYWDYKNAPPHPAYLSFIYIMFIDSANKPESTELKHLSLLPTSSKETQHGVYEI